MIISWYEWSTWFTDCRSPSIYDAYKYIGWKKAWQSPCSYTVTHIISTIGADNGLKVLLNTVQYVLPSQCAKHGREIKRLNHKPGFHGQNYTPSVIDGREKLVHLISRCIFYYLADSETKVILCRGTKIECVTKSNKELLIKVPRWATDRVFPNVNVIYRQWGILPRAASRALTMAHVRMCPSRTFCDVILIWLLSQFKFSTSVYFLFYGIKRLGIFKINGENHRIILPKELFLLFVKFISRAWEGKETWKRCHWSVSLYPAKKRTRAGSSSFRSPAKIPGKQLPLKARFERFQHILNESVVECWAKLE